MSSYRALHEIAADVSSDWENVSLSAAPYLLAMRSLTTVDDFFGADSAKNIILYFLNNAARWRTDKAKLIKAELRAMVDGKPITVVEASKNICPRCALGDHTREPREDKIRHTATVKRPSLVTMARWMDDGVAKATDGCKVEPDGVCSHGHLSWCVQLGVV